MVAMNETRLSPSQMQIEFIRKLYNLGWWLVPNWGLVPCYPFPDKQMCACPNGSKCNQPGKHPMERWANQPRHTLWNLEQAATRHRGNVYRAMPNWAVRLKASKLCVIDIDNHAGGPDGAASWANLVAEHGPLPKTVADNHGHLYFRLADDSPTWNKTAYQLAPGVELLGGSSDHDHLIIVPPSDHHSGNGYEFLDGRDPWSCEIATLPEWVEKARADEDKRTFVPEPARSPKYQKFESHVRAHGVNDPARVKRAAAWLDHRPPQNGHDYKRNTAYIIAVGFGLSESDAVSLMLDWDRRCPPSKSPDNMVEMVRTALNSGRGSFGFKLNQKRGPRKPFEPVNRIDTPTTAPAETCSCKRICCPQCDEFYSDLTADEIERYELAKEVETALDDWDESAPDPLPDEPAPATAEEAVVAIESMRRTEYPCLRSQTVLIERYDWKKDGTVLDLIDPRCNAWNCPACASLHKEEWCVNYRYRIVGDYSAAKPMWSMMIPKESQATVTKRIQRANGEYFFCEATPEIHGEGMRLIVANVAFNGADEVDARDAADRLCACVRAYSGRSKPTGSSRGWQLPKRPKGNQKLRRIGVVRDGGISTADAIAIGDKHGVQVGRIDVPHVHKFRVRLWRVADVSGLSFQQRRDFYSDLLTIRKKRNQYSEMTGSVDVNTEPDWANEWHDEWKAEQCPINTKRIKDNGLVGQAVCN